MNYVDSLVQHSVHCCKGFRDAEPSSQSCRAGVCNIGDPNNSCIRNSLDRTGMKFTYIAGTN